MPCASTWTSFTTQGPAPTVVVISNTQLGYTAPDHSNVTFYLTAKYQSDDWNDPNLISYQTNEIAYTIALPTMTVKTIPNYYVFYKEDATH